MLSRKLNVLSYAFYHIKLFYLCTLYAEKTILLRDLKFCWIQIWK